MCIVLLVYNHRTLSDLIVWSHNPDKTIDMRLLSYELPGEAYQLNKSDGHTYSTLQQANKTSRSFTIHDLPRVSSSAILETLFRGAMTQPLYPVYAHRQLSGQQVPHTIQLSFTTRIWILTSAALTIMGTEGENKTPQFYFRPGLSSTAKRIVGK